MICQHPDKFGIEISKLLPFGQQKGCSRGDRKNLPDYAALSAVNSQRPKPESGNLQKRSCFIGGLRKELALNDAIPTASPY